MGLVALSSRTLLSGPFCLLREMRDQNIGCWFKAPTLLSLHFLTSKGRSVWKTVLLCQNSGIQRK